MTISACLALSFGCSNSEVTTDSQVNMQIDSSEINKPGKGLVASISVPVSAVSMKEPMVVHFELANKTTAPLSVLSWGTPLESGFTREIFKVTRGGQPVQYIGRQVKRGSPTVDDFVTVATGSSVQASIDLRKGYQVDVPGEYLVTLNLPYVTTRVNDQESLQAVMTGGTASIQVRP